MILVYHYAIWPPIPKTISIKHCRVEIIACPFVLFHNDRFFKVCCLFSQRFSRCDKPELTRWCLCSLQASIQMSPDEVVGSRDNCCHSMAESTVDVSIRVFWQISSCSRVLLHDLQLTSDRCLIFASQLATGMFPANRIKAWWRSCSSSYCCLCV